MIVKVRRECEWILFIFFVVYYFKFIIIYKDVDVKILEKINNDKMEVFKIKYLLYLEKNMINS